MKSTAPSLAQVAGTVPSGGDYVSRALYQPEVAVRSSIFAYRSLS